MPSTAASRKIQPTRRGTRPAPATRPRAATQRGGSALTGYLRYSKTPWASLLLILPLLVLHEVGVAWYGGIPPAGEHRITAFVLMARFFGALGASAPLLPAMAVVAVLLAWHLATEEGGTAADGWAVRPGAVLGMATESLAWAAPLIGVYFLFSPTAPTFDVVADRNLMGAMYLGAGVYEEAAFRLAGFAVLSFVIADVGRLRGSVAVPVVVVTAAAAFSAYHLWGNVSWPWQAFVFTGLRGVYYGIIFLERGFGLSVGVHTAYDLLFLGLGGIA